MIRKNEQNRKPLRILMQIRPNAYTQRGGDTIVLEQLSQGLAMYGYEVSVDVQGTRDPRDFDVVHLFNFATPAITQEFASRASKAGVPVVVTTLYEDIPSFHSQSHLVAQSLIDYVRGGQQKSSWTLSVADVCAVPRATRFPADEIVDVAAALLPNGAGEAQALRRDFPNARRIIEVPVGHDLGVKTGSDLFERTYGLRDFVLCVGRLESRKNQLMLLKALEDSPLTVVLAAGGFSYQPEYEAAIRSFKRKGRTIILGRVEPEMLSSAYAASRIHVLPSWYELPGLVSLEAAAHGKNIVTTRTGTTADYVGDTAFYCLPWDADSISSAVSAAYYSPKKDELETLVSQFTWDNAVQRTLQVYQDVVESSERKLTRVGSSSVVAQGVYDMNMNITDFQDALERGEMAAKNSDFGVAEEYLRKAEQMNPTSTRVLKARGAVLLAQLKHEEARELFDRALSLEPIDAKLLAGRGMCDLVAHNPQGAIGFFEKAVNVAPEYLVALYQLLECAYSLGKFGPALQALERYLSIKPFDSDMRFCYAGCLYKSGQLDEAKVQIKRILDENPAHQGAGELNNIMTATAISSDGADKGATVNATTGDASTPGDEIREALSELSAQVKSWKVASPADPIVAPSTQSARVWSDTEILTTMGQIEDLKRAGDFTEAMRVLADLQDSASLSDHYREIVDCLNAEFTVLGGDFVKASSMYDAVLARNQGSSRALCGKGALAAERQEWGTARQFFNKAREANPEYDVAIAGLGLCAMVENNVEEAFGLFQLAVEKNPENNRALLGVLQTGYPLKRYSEMERMLSAYLDLHPASIDMLYSFAGVLYAQGKVKEARMEVEKILIFEPEHEHALELRGMIDNSATTSQERSV